MAVKYRIEYGNYSRYRKGSILKKLAPYLFPIILFTSFILFIAYSHNPSNLYELILPGDPAVTADAFEQLSEAIGRGDAFADALDVFCETIMEVR